MSAGRAGGEREGPHTTLRLPNALTLRLSSQDTMFRYVSEGGMKRGGGGEARGT